MTKEEFIFRVKRITDSFGDAHYTKERIQLLWNQMKHKDPLTFNYAIDGLLSTEKHAPTINKIMQSMWESERKMQRDAPKESFPCNECDSSGILTRSIKMQGVDYSCAFRCECKNGQKLSRHIPPIADFETSGTI